MAKVTKVTIHITASSDNATVEQIRAQHMDQGWSDIGYHWIVDRQGIVHAGRPESKTGAHVGGYNTGNIGISYIARGKDTDSNAPYGKYMTPAQKHGLEAKTADVLYRHNLTVKDIYGHNDFPGVAKACPCFKVRKSKEFLDAVQAELDELKYGGAGGKKPAEPEMAEAVDGEDAEVDTAPKAATKV